MLGMAIRYEPTDVQFEILRDVLPRKAGDPARIGEVINRFLIGTMWVLRNRSHWLDRIRICLPNVI
jgi:hypothetical protein